MRKGLFSHRRFSETKLRGRSRWNIESRADYLRRMSSQRRKQTNSKKGLPKIKPAAVHHGPVEHCEIRMPVKSAQDNEAVKARVLDALGWDEGQLQDYRVVRKNLDARRKPVLAVWNVEAFRCGVDIPNRKHTSLQWPRVDEHAASVYIVGAGPAGLFAALECLRIGLKPILIERGQPVRQRRRDLVQITRSHQVNPDSNYCFGEGGAGTYSDGKLYTRSHKRGDIQGALETLVHFGADPDILIEAHPHIGTNKLPAIIEAMRAAIIASGGVVHFGARLVDINISRGQMAQLKWKIVSESHPIETAEVPCDQLILATGHSARDVFELLHSKGLELQAKPFAMGVRVEHPQHVIDRVQYHGEERGDWLPAASYRLVCQADGRGVHSFCMCPGGIIAPCATSNDEIVTNGWSPSKRNNPFANSGIVVQLGSQDWEAAGHTGPLGAMHFQASVERACWAAAGKTQAAPAQRLVDFLKGPGGQLSNSLPANSYLPGVVSVNLRKLLPPVIADALAEGLRTFGRRMPEFLHPDAILVAPESRTSSPVRIPRDPDSLCHPEVAGLFPAGEGAGYAGGILSAALDGIRVAQAVNSYIQTKKKPTL